MCVARVTRANSLCRGNVCPSIVLFRASWPPVALTRSLPIFAAHVFRGLPLRLDPHCLGCRFVVNKTWRQGSVGSLLATAALCCMCWWRIFSDNGLAPAAFKTSALGALGNQAWGTPGAVLSPVVFFSPQAGKHDFTTTTFHSWCETKRILT